MGANLAKRVQQLLGRLRLTNNTNVFLHRQYLGYPGAKDCLVVSDDDVDHSWNTLRFRSAFLGGPEFNFANDLPRLPETEASLNSGLYHECAAKDRLLVTCNQ